MKLLDEYFEIQQKIYDYFGYEEEWKVIPLEDRRMYLWYVSEDGVIFAEKIEDFETGNYYGDEIYTYRFLPKYIYETEDYTMICVDTHTDGNKFLAIYDSQKRLKEDPIEEKWDDEYEE